MPGWDLSVTWLTEEGLPKKGLLSFEFFAGAGLQLLGCKVDLPLRTALYPLVLMEQRDYYEEILAGDMLRDEGAEGDKEGPLRKLRAQQNLIYKLNDYVPSSTDPSILSLRRVIAEDANRHLSDYTDITWNYTNDNGGKFEPWLVVD